MSFGCLHRTKLTHKFIPVRYWKYKLTIRLSCSDMSNFNLYETKKVYLTRITHTHTKKVCFTCMCENGVPYLFDSYEHAKRVCFNVVIFFFFSFSKYGTHVWPKRICYTCIITFLTIRTRNLTINLQIYLLMLLQK